MGKPFTQNLVLYEGSGFYPERVVWKAGATAEALAPVNLTGCTARMQVRLDYDDPTALLTLDTADGSLVLTYLEGVIEFEPTLESITGLGWESAVYDLEVTHPGQSRPRRLVQGKVKVSREATRD